MKTGRIIAIYFIISSLFCSFGFSNPNDEKPAAEPKKISDELGSVPQTPGVIARHHWEFIDPLDGLFTTYWERDYSGGFVAMNVFAGGYSLTVDYSAATIENPCTVVGKGIKPCWGGTVSWDMEGKVDLSAFGVYGWLREPLVEYYIGRDGGDYVGEYDVGERHYTLYIGFKDRENIVAPEGEGSPFIMLNCDGPRESPIDLSKHYAAWESLLEDYPIPEGWTWHSIVLPDYCVVGSEIFGKRAGSSIIKNITVTGIQPTRQP